MKSIVFIITMVLFIANVSSQSYSREEIEGNLVAFSLFAKEKSFDEIKSVLKSRNIKYTEEIFEKSNYVNILQFDWYRYASIGIYSLPFYYLSNKTSGQILVSPKDMLWFREFTKYVRNKYTKYGYHPSEEFFEIKELESYIDFIYTDGKITHFYLNHGDESFRREVVSKRKLR